MDLPTHATILVHLLSPLDVTHAEEHISKIKAHGSSNAQLADATQHPHAWRIMNKYYSADVGFKIVDLSLEEGDDAGEEPAIIVLAPRHATPHPALAPFLARLSARSNEFEIALLVTLPHSGDSELDQDAWEDLALEHGFEWVDGKESDALGEEEEDGEEKGIARVVGALHAHLWEGMVRETPEGRGRKTEESTEAVEEEGDDEMGLGAPPLPEPRPFVPTPLAFPSTFLPSLARPSTISTSTASLIPPATTFFPISPPAPLDPAAFDDDFAPFVPALSTCSFPPLTPSSSTTPESSTPLYRHPELSFPDTEDLILGSEGEEEDLLELVEKLRGMREDAKGMGVEERRAMAERVVVGLFGE